MSITIKNTNINAMRNFFRLFNKFLRLSTLFSSSLVNKRGNVVRPGPAPLCSDLHVVALALSAEALGIDSERFLFQFLERSSSFSLPLSRRRFNQRRKLLTELINSIRSNMSGHIDSSEVYIVNLLCV